MNASERYQRATELFHAALKLPVQERAAYLREACAGDDALHEEALSLLANDESSASLDINLGAGVGANMLAHDLASTERGAQQHPDRLGNYRIVRLHGRGGMGVVYEAEQDNPRRRVALKLLRPDAQYAALVKRFQREAQVLGRLQHSGIAQVYEAGTVESNGATQPFIAMEFIDGDDLQIHIREGTFDRNRKLELIAEICDAVHIAHEAGIVHRDLKPSNILIDKSGAVKVVDFGVARVTEPGADLLTLQTEVGQLVGTLSYMSPEQIGGDSRQIDRRTDVYALGVILHELLTGKLPYQLRGLAIPEAARVVRDEEPSRLSSINTSYRGDIETIVGKALEKEPSRRYQTAADLATDLRRHLNDQPIAARPASTWYQLEKFARRNRGLVAGVSFAFVALLVGLVGTLYFLFESNAQRDSAIIARNDAIAARKEADAERQKAIAARDAAVVSERRTQLAMEFQRELMRGVDLELLGHQILGDWRAALLDTADTDDARIRLAADMDRVSYPLNPTDLARTFLDRAVLERMKTQIERGATDDSLLEATLRETLGATLKALGLYQRSVPQFERSAALYESALGPDHEKTVTVLSMLGEIYRLNEQYNEAERVLLLAIAGIEVALGVDHSEHRNAQIRLASLYVDVQRMDEAEQIYARIVEYESTQEPPNYDRLTSALIDFGNLRRAQGKLQDARELYKSAYEHAGEHLGKEHRSYRTAGGNLARTQKDLGLPSESLLLEVIEIQERVLGRNHPRMLRDLQSLASVYRSENRIDEALDILSQALATSIAVSGESSAETLRLKSAMASIYARSGRFDEAEQFMSEAYRGFENVLGADHRHTLSAMANLGVVYVMQRRFDEAIELRRRTVTIMNESLGPNHPATLTTAVNLGTLLADLDRNAEAVAVLTDVVPRINEALGPNHSTSKMANEVFNRARAAIPDTDEANGNQSEQ